MFGESKQPFAGTNDIPCSSIFVSSAIGELSNFSKAFEKRQKRITSLAIPDQGYDQGSSHLLPHHLLSRHLLPHLHYMPCYSRSRGYVFQIKGPLTFCLIFFCLSIFFSTPWLPPVPEFSRLILMLSLPCRLFFLSPFVGRLSHFLSLSLSRKGESVL